MNYFLFVKGSVAACPKEGPKNSVVEVDQVTLELSCSRQRRLQNDIVLESSALRCHRGTAEFIALIGKSSRRLEELDSEILRKHSIGHHANLNGRGFPIFFVVFDLGGSELIASSPEKAETPRKSEIKPKVKKPSWFIVA